MKSNELVQLDKEIETMEKGLSALHQKRVKLAEGILAEAMQASKSLPGQSPPKPVRSRAKRNPAPKKAAGAAPKKAQPAKKVAKKTVRLTSEVVIRRLQAAVKAGGSGGLSAIEISKASGIKYRTALENLKKMNKLFIQKGEGGAARYSLAE